MSEPEDIDLEDQDEPERRPTRKGVRTEKITEVVTREETLRFALAMATSPWAETVLPMAWKRMGSGHRGTEGMEWRDVASRKPIPRAEVRERIAEAVENDLGFTPTKDEVCHLEAILEEARNHDPLHQFVYRYFERAPEDQADLDDAWSLWKGWRPVSLAMPQAAWIAALTERGYRVEGETLVGFRKRGKAVPVRTGKRGANRKEGSNYFGN